MDLNKLMQQAQKMQKDMESKQEELAAKVYEVSVGGGAVKVIVTGSCQVEDIQIDESLLEKENKEELQDLLLMAINKALAEAIQEKDKAMGHLVNP